MGNRIRKQLTPQTKLRIKYDGPGRKPKEYHIEAVKLGLEQPKDKPATPPQESGSKRDVERVFGYSGKIVDRLEQNGFIHPDRMSSRRVVYSFEQIRDYQRWIREEKPAPASYTAAKFHAWLEQKKRQ